MLMHVSRNHECLLFVSSGLHYGPASACFIVGLLPLFSALFIFILIVLHIWQLTSLKRYLRNPDIPHSSKDYHNRPTHIFWRMVVFHGLVTLMMLVTVAVITSGYSTTCTNVTRDVKLKVRSRRPLDRFGGGLSQGYDYERFRDQNSIDRYRNPSQVADVYGYNTYERAITCRSVLTDTENTKIFKENHEQNPLYRQYFTPNQRNQPVADFGNIRYYTYRDNLILELSMAGSWLCFALLAVVMILMTTQRHHLRAHIRDESMWGGSEYGRRSVSRISNRSFDDRGSQYSHQSGSRYSASRGSRPPRQPRQGGPPSDHNSSYRAPQQTTHNNSRGQHPLPNRVPQPPPNEPNGLLSYFAENPPVDEEIDIDAALNDQSLDDMMDQEPHSYPDQYDGKVKDLSGPVADTSFGSEGLPHLDATLGTLGGDPLPLGDEVSSGQIYPLPDLPISQPSGPRDPNRVTGRRGARHSTSSRSPSAALPEVTTYTQEVRTSTHDKFEYRGRAPPNGANQSYRTQLGNTSMI